MYSLYNFPFLIFMLGSTKVDKRNETSSSLTEIIARWAVVVIDAFLFLYYSEEKENSLFSPCENWTHESSNLQADAVSSRHDGPQFIFNKCNTIEFNITSTFL